MLTLTDQIGRSLSLSHPAQRIISLCPSITETLYSLGLEEQLVGRTHFCIHPKDKAKQLTSVGGTKNVNLERVAQLAPDLIIAEKEENTQEIVNSLAENYPVLVTDVTDFGTALDMLHLIGKACQVRDRANRMVEEISVAFHAIPLPQPMLPSVYLIWKDPFMLASHYTYISDLMGRCGFQNLALSLQGRYPVVDREKLKSLNPEYVLLSSEPFPFQEKHLAEFQVLLPKAKILLVDGEMFSWYGVRMLEVPGYLTSLMAKITQEK